MTRTNSSAIFSAARKCVLERGLSRTTVTDIARQAKVSRMTIYRRWKNSSDLVLDMLTHDFTMAVSRATSTVPTNISGRQRLVATCLAVLDDLGQDSVLESIRFHDPQLLAPYLLERTGASQKLLIDTMVSMIRAGQKDGTVRDIPVEEAAYMLIFTLQSFLISYDILHRESNFRAVLNELADSIDRYLMPL